MTMLEQQPSLFDPPLEPVPAGRLTDTDWLLGMLNDGRPHTHAEILGRSFRERRCGLTVHSRAADLRKRGHTVACTVTLVNGRRSSQYQLLR